MADVISTRLTWNGGRLCDVSFGRAGPVVVTGRANLEESPGSWSPPHLLAAASAACFMLNFLAVAEKARIEITSYESETEAVIDLPDGRHKEVVGIIIRPKVGLKNEAERKRLPHLFQKAEEYCTVGNSLKFKTQVKA